MKKLKTLSLCTLMAVYSCDKKDNRPSFEHAVQFFSGQGTIERKNYLQRDGTRIALVEKHSPMDSTYIITDIFFSYENDGKLDKITTIYPSEGLREHTWGKNQE
jgi:hypothetical protein